MEPKQWFLVGALSKGRLIYTYRNQQTMFACAHGLGQQFSGLKPDGTQKIGKQMCREVPSISRASSATYFSNQSSSGELTSNWCCIYFTFQDSSNNPKLSRSMLDFSTWQSFVSFSLAPHVLSPRNIVACCLLAGLVYWASPEKTVGNTYWSCG